MAGFATLKKFHLTSKGQFYKTFLLVTNALAFLALAKLNNANLPFTITSQSNICRLDRGQSVRYTIYMLT